VKSVFADTAFYVAIINERDALHLAVREFSRQSRGHIVTTEYDLVELGNWFARSAHRNCFGYLIQQVFGDSKTTIVPAERSLLLEGVDLYVSRADKDWSLTDCVSFIVMRRFALTDALTDDHHFEQAGFNLLLS
jgi:predicted nucleic acid-binding protein